MVRVVPPKLVSPEMYKLVEVTLVALIFVGLKVRLPRLVK